MKTPTCNACEHYACGYGRIPYRICKKAVGIIPKPYKTSPMWCPNRKMPADAGKGEVYER